jgi:hypothetical protein
MPDPLDVQVSTIDRIDDDVRRAEHDEFPRIADAGRPLNGCMAV